MSWPAVAVHGRGTRCWVVPALRRVVATLAAIAAIAIAVRTLPVSAHEAATLASVEVVDTSEVAPANPAVEPVPAPAVEVSAPPTSGPAPAAAAPLDEASPLDEALGRLSYPWRELGFELVVAPGRAGLYARTTASPRQIVLYHRVGQTAEQLEFVLAHEIGHAIDLSRLTPQDRAAWREVRGIPADADWFGCNDCDDLATPAGDFAESFAAWQAGPTFYGGRLAPPPDAAAIVVLERITR